MYSIPLKAVANQNLSPMLAGQLVQLSLRTLMDGNLYMDVSLNNKLLVSNVSCQNLNRIVRDAYLGLSGDLFFMDTQGNETPVYTGLGDRFQLMYLTAAEVAAL